MSFNTVKAQRMFDTINFFCVFFLRKLIIFSVFLAYIEKYPDAMIIDVTSKAEDEFVKLSPFYPIGDYAVNPLDVTKVYSCTLLINKSNSFINRIPDLFTLTIRPNV